MHETARIPSYDWPCLVLPLLTERAKMLQRGSFADIFLLLHPSTSGVAAFK